MISSNEAVKLIKNLSLVDRLIIVEEILKGIREEEMLEENEHNSKADHNNGPAILAMAGILDDEEASVFDTAIAESRKIDEDEW